MTPETRPTDTTTDAVSAGEVSIGAAQQPMRRDYASEHAARVSAEAAVFIRDRVLSIVSHDLRGPLNAIHSWAHVLERKLSSDDPGIARAIAGIRTGVEQQVKLIEDIIDRTRSGTRHLALDLSTAGLLPLIEGELDNVRVTVAQARGVTVNAQLDLDGVEGQVDAQRFAQSIWSLLAYAVGATSDGAVDLIAQHAGKKLEISVAFMPVPTSQAAPESVSGPDEPANGAALVDGNGAHRKAVLMKTRNVFAEVPAHLDNGKLPLALPLRVVAAHEGDLSDEELVDGRRRITLHYTLRS